MPVVLVGLEVEVAWAVAALVGAAVLEVAAVAALVAEVHRDHGEFQTLA